jgi:hypothetical protein
MIDMMAGQTPSKEVLDDAKQSAVTRRKLEPTEFKALVAERLDALSCATCNGTHHPPGEPLGRCPDCWENQKQIIADINEEYA